MWPILFEINVGESYPIYTKNGLRQIKLLDYKEYYSPEFFTREPSHQSFSYAEVTIDVSGEIVNLIHRPFQLPKVVNGLRISVEAMKNWGNKCHIQPMIDLLKDVRFSVLPEYEHWGPKDIVFPINKFRWQSSPYHNTWGSLVPYNEFYYHRGEDFGAIPDHLDVVAIRSGLVVQSPITNRDGANALTILSEDNHLISYYHMNIESINPDLKVGSLVKAGDFLGKTGETWGYMHKQNRDPHLHISFHENQALNFPNKWGDYLYNTFPFLIEAYFNKYTDNVLAITGGNYFSLPGKEVTLDATRSIARQGEEIVSYSWVLSNGKTADLPVTNISYEKPGLYAEELRVKTKSGDEDRNYAHVRVFDPERPGHLGGGFCYHFPVRHIVPGTEVLIWDRINENSHTPVIINFGDGSEERVIKRECTHVYDKSGFYTITMSTKGPELEPINVKMRIVVENI